MTGSVGCTELCVVFTLIEWNKSSYARTSYSVLNTIKTRKNTNNYLLFTAHNYLHSTLLRWRWPVLTARLLRYKSRKISACGHNIIDTALLDHTYSTNDGQLRPVALHCVFSLNRHDIPIGTRIYYVCIADGKKKKKKTIQSGQFERTRVTYLPINFYSVEFNVCCGQLVSQFAIKRRGRPTRTAINFNILQYTSILSSKYVRITSSGYICTVHPRCTCDNA